MTPFDRPAKRIIDVIASLLGLVLALPLLAAIAVVVKLDSPGPVFFGHERIGRHGVPFKVWKIRTMVPDAGRHGRQITVAGDDRITRWGHVLRRTKLDELPQLWNVLRGQMSLVGPRPEVARYVALFPREYDTLLELRPGITDWASVAFRREEELLARADDPEAEYVRRILPRKLQLNLEYCRDPSIRKDFEILARTAWEVLFR